MNYITLIFFLTQPNGDDVYKGVPKDYTKEVKLS